MSLRGLYLEGLINEGAYFRNFTVSVMDSYVSKSFSRYLFPAIIYLLPTELCW